jgi:parallel beta-helix repeat protein
MLNPKFTQTNKILASGLIITLLLLSSLFLGTFARTTTTLNVSISGPEKLGVNQAGTYIASVNNSKLAITYTWSITPQDNTVILTPSNAKCNLTFVKATDQVYSLSVSARTSSGDSGAYAITVIDPYNSPGYKFDASTASASWIIQADGLGWYRAINGADGSVNSASTSTNSTTLFTSVYSASTIGSTIVFTSGSYNPIYAINKDNITIVFNAGASIFVPNSWNNPAIYLDNCDNWLIQGVSINGNAANQNLGGTGPSGVAIKQSSNSRVDNAVIYNIRQFGFYTWYNSIYCGITNSKILNCGWNGITLGGGGGVYSCYAINNEIAYCSDVGATAYGYSSIIQNNYVHDMNGTTGGGGSSQWGIAVEDGGNNMITGNTISNAAVGIDVNTGINTISGNNIQSGSITLSYAINIQANTPAQLITGNNIAIIGGDYGTRGINLNNNGNTVSGNIINSTNPQANGMDIAGNYNQILSNNIYVSTVSSGGGNRGIYIAGNYTKISDNVFIGGTTTGIGVGWNGISIPPVGTVITDNDFRQWVGNSIIGDFGTSSQITEVLMNPANLGNLGVLNGQISTVVVKENVAVGNLLFRNSTGVFLAKATSTATMNVEYMAIQTISANGNCQVITSGTFRNDAWSSMTVGATGYCSTASAPTTTAPSASGNVIQDIGKADAAKIFDFYNSGAWGTHV